MTSATALRLLRRFESRNIAPQSPGPGWPIVWERARDLHVRDPEGRVYLDLTAAFGVAATGHANPRVVAAGQQQLKRLPHAMGDVHPHPSRALLAQALSRMTFERWTRSPGGRSASPALRGKTIFGNSGFEAVEAALKTARLATGRRDIIAFTGAYHGLGYGTLNATHRGLFRNPFRDQLGDFGHWAPFPQCGPHDDSAAAGSEEDQVLSRVRLLARQHPVGAILVEPVQGRGGIHVPRPTFLRGLHTIARESGALLILDEILTGFGRTGRWFACEHSGVTPDLVCLGKALTGGFPLSACVGRADVMDAAWPASDGEAIHTSTFLGNPVGCAMALAQIRELERRNLPARAHRLGIWLQQTLPTLLHPAPHGTQLAIRGMGLLWGIAVSHPNPTRSRDQIRGTATVIATTLALLKRGILILPEGEHGDVLSLSPPLTIRQHQLRDALGILRDCLDDASRNGRRRGHQPRRSTPP